MPCLFLVHIFQIHTESVCAWHQALGSWEEQNRNVPEQIKTFNINFITVLKLDKCHYSEISANSGIILLATAICIKYNPANIQAVLSA